MCHSCVHPLSLEKEVTACLYWRVLSLEWPQLCNIDLKDILFGWTQSLSRNHVYMACKYGLACSACTQCRHIPIFPTCSWPLHSVSMSGEPGSRCSHTNRKLEFREGGKQDTLKRFLALKLVSFYFSPSAQSHVRVSLFKTKPSLFHLWDRAVLKEVRSSHTRTQHPIGPIWQLKIQPLMP